MNKSNKLRKDKMNKQEFDKKRRAIWHHIYFWSSEIQKAIRANDSVRYNKSTMKVHYWQQREITLSNEFFMESTD